MVIKIDGVKVGTVEDYLLSNVIASKYIFKKSEYDSQGIAAKPPYLFI